MDYRWICNQCFVRRPRPAARRFCFQFREMANGLVKFDGHQTGLALGLLAGLTFPISPALGAGLFVQSHHLVAGEVCGFTSFGDLGGCDEDPDVDGGFLSVGFGLSF